MTNSKSKVTIVTGAASGIGKAISLTLANNNYKVFLFDKDETGLMNLCNNELKNYDTDYFCGNVTNKSDIDKAIKQCISKYSRVDSLIANAGIIEKSEFLEITEQQWDNTIDVNLKGVFLWGQSVANWMVDNNIAGSIVNIGCMRANLVTKNLSAYATSKAGVRTLTKAMAVELASYNINVNTIEPGRTLTDGLQQHITNKQDEADRLNLIPIGRFANPSEIGDLALFLISENAKYITGASIPVDGGYSISKE